MRPCPAAGLRRPAPCFSPHVASGQRISGALACAAGWCGLVVRLACAGCGGGCVCQGRARRCCGSGLPLRARVDQAHGVGVLHLYIFVALHTYIYATLRPLIGAGLRACCICCTCCSVFLVPKYLHSLALVCIMPPAYLFHCFLAGLLSYRGTFRGTVFSARRKSPVPCGLQLDSMVPFSVPFSSRACRGLTFLGLAHRIAPLSLQDVSCSALPGFSLYASR